MQKAGASGHDKVQVVKLHSQRVPEEQIARATSLKPEHVKAIIARYKAGNKDRISVPDRLQYEVDPQVSAEQTQRITDLEEQNAALSEKLDAILAKLGGATEPPAADTPKADPEPVATAEAETSDGDAEDDDDTPDDKPAPQRRRRRVANE